MSTECRCDKFPYKSGYYELKDIDDGKIIKACQNCNICEKCPIEISGTIIKGKRFLVIDNEYKKE